MEEKLAGITLSVVGAGHRGGDAYGDFCLRHPERARVVAVAEPDDRRRTEFAEAHGIPEQHRYRDWADLLARDRLSDGLVVATPDLIRSGPVIRGAELGYGLLVEKPLAATEGELEDIVAALERTNALVGVAHVLRYTPFFTTLKDLVANETVGRLIHVEQTEDIGYWHFAHSYVRGNWRRQADGAPMLLAKACHDLDVITWLVDLPLDTVHSTGALAHFRADHAPEGATERCTDGCPAAAQCPFYAPRLYLERLRAHDTWPASAVSRESAPESRLEALQTGPYGRCVYRLDNDQVDHQVVSLTFAGGVIATLRVGAFTASNTRTIRILGSHGEISGRLDTGEIEVRRFLPATGHQIQVWQPWDRDQQGRSGLPDDERWTVRAAPVGPRADDSPGRRESDGHAGGDDGLMEAFVARLDGRRDGDDSVMPTHVRDTARSHRIAFAAERSRHTGSVVRYSA
jgi:predicted dehydrogenase